MDERKLKGIHSCRNILLKTHKISLRKLVGAYLKNSSLRPSWHVALPIFRDFTTDISPQLSIGASRIGSIVKGKHKFTAELMTGQCNMLLK